MYINANYVLYKMVGYLEIVIGSMWCGKTTWIISQYNRSMVYTDKIVVINYIGDKRYAATGLSTHDKTNIPCIQTKLLSDVTINDDIDVILINEGQFFDDIVEWVKDMVDIKGKKVYICGLDGDYKREKFGHLLELIPYCDKVQKLSAVCGKCNDGTPAIFTSRTTHNISQILIGEKEHYLPVCRKCYM